MVEPVNLNRFRKQKARAADKVRAERNAVQFGRPKPEKDADKAQTDKARHDLDGHELEP